MERLTKRVTDGQAIMDCEKCKADWTGKHGKSMVDCTPLYCRNRLKDRLAAYEETGLTPEQCESAKNIIEYAFSADTSKAERIRELLKADKDGRLVVLPCNLCARLYEVTGRKTISVYKVRAICVGLFGSFIEWDIVEGFVWRSLSGINAGEIGKTVFLTREEAEKALEALKDE